MDAISYTIEREYKIIAYRVSPSDTLDEDLIVEDHRRETLKSAGQRSGCLI